MENNVSSNSPDLAKTSNRQYLMIHKMHKQRGDADEDGCAGGGQEEPVELLGHITLTLIPGLPSKPEAPCVVMEV